MAAAFSQGRRPVRAALLVVLLAGCAQPLACPMPEAAGAPVWLVDRGWHVEIGMRAADLRGGLAGFRGIYPEAVAFMFGYGKRTFFTAPVESADQYLLGPVPGSAAIQVTALALLPPAAYPIEDVTEMRLPPGRAETLSEFLATDIARNEDDALHLIGPGRFPGSAFYAARSTYSLAHTCNTWVADALDAAGLGVSGSGVVFSGQVIGRAVAAGACRPASP